jgi:hypothetical protein
VDTLAGGCCRLWKAAAAAVDGRCAAPTPGMAEAAAEAERTTSLWSRLVTRRLPNEAPSTGPCPRAPPSRGISPCVDSSGPPVVSHTALRRRLCC